MHFFLIPQESFNPNIRFLDFRSKGVPCSPFTHTDRQTHADRDTTEGTLSGFKFFFLQPIIKDRRNIFVKKNTNILVILFPVIKKYIELFYI